VSSRDETTIAQLKAAAAARRPVDERERESIAELISSLDHLQAPFEEHADPLHVTGSAIVVGPRGVLLHRHKRLGIWLQPGGHIDAGETPAEAALREAQEETGLSLVHHTPEPVLVHIDAHPGPRGHRHLDVRYLLVGGDEDPSPPEGESQDVRWFAWPEAREMADPGLDALLSALEPADLQTVQIRTATAADAAAVAEIYLRSRTAALPGFPWAHDDADVRQWIAEVQVPQGDVLVADVTGVIMAMMIRRGDLVEQLYVDVPWWGRGIGSLLLEQAKAGGTPLELWTFVANERARDFYARHGFREIRRTDGDNEEGQPDVLLRWER
jgi:8-oxo-dGTP pyrophosphatase MutT (NUDIX family)/GNAT superfamily N-acetyltransferase